MKCSPASSNTGEGTSSRTWSRAAGVKMEANSYGTDCYPNRRWERDITLADVNEAILFNPRNAYQNYNVAVNRSDRMIYTYMGSYGRSSAMANYCSAGQLSLCSTTPAFRTIGIQDAHLPGRRGKAAWYGTAPSTIPACPVPKAARHGFPPGPSPVLGDLKGMNPRWLVGSSFLGYRSTLSVGLGIPIPVLNAEVAGRRPSPTRSSSPR